MTDIFNYYRSNKDFKEYVDRFAKKHRMLPEFAMTCQIVVDYYKYLKSIEIA